MATPSFWKIVEVMSGLSLGTRVSNLKSVALTVLELLAFNSHDRPLRTHKQLLAFNGQKIRGSRDRGHAPFWENFWAVPGNMYVKFEVRSFNRFGVISI